MSRSSSPLPAKSSGSSASRILRSPPREVLVGPTRWREDGLRRVGALAFATLVAVVLGMVARQTWMGVVAWFVLVLAMWPVWLPVRYRLSRHGVEQWIFGWQRRHLDWRHISSWSWHHHGVYLRGRSARRWLPGYFAIFVPWHDAQSDIIAMLEYYVIAGNRREGSTRSHVGTEASADDSSPSPPSPPASLGGESLRAESSQAEAGSE